MARDMSWSERHGRDAYNRAVQRWGSGWMMLSTIQQEMAVAYEVVALLLVQDEDTAPPQVLRLQEAARVAMAKANPGSW